MLLIGVDSVENEALAISQYVIWSDLHSHNSAKWGKGRIWA